MASNGGSHQIIQKLTVHEAVGHKQRFTLVVGRMTQPKCLSADTCPVFGDSCPRELVDQRAIGSCVIDPEFVGPLPPDTDDPATICRWTGSVEVGEGDGMLLRVSDP